MSVEESAGIPQYYGSPDAKHLKQYFTFTVFIFAFFIFTFFGFTFYGFIFFGFTFFGFIFFGFTFFGFTFFGFTFFGFAFHGFIFSGFTFYGFIFSGFTFYGFIFSGFTFYGFIFSGFTFYGFIFSGGYLENAGKMRGSLICRRGTPERLSTKCSILTVVGSFSPLYYLLFTCICTTIIIFLVWTRAFISSNELQYLHCSLMLENILC